MPRKNGTNRGAKTKCHPIRHARLALGLTQEAMATRLGITRVTLARIEVGMRKPGRQLAATMQSEIEALRSKR